MTSWVLFALLSAITLFVVAGPLWRRRADKALGRGVETDEPTRRWATEKDRLIAEQRALDLTLARGEISEAIHGQERALLQQEATRALDQLRRARTATPTDPGTQRRPRTYPLAAAALAAAVVISSAALTNYLAQQDMRRDVSPHADGGPPAGETGADGPDVAAMVAQLESKVTEAGDGATVGDLLMLARSYRVIDRKDEAIALYRRVLAVDARNITAVMALGAMLLNSPQQAERAEAGRQIKTALSLSPGLPEALWLKSLWLMRSHKMAEAKTLLQELLPKVAGDPTARNAVETLLARLAEVETSPAVRPN